MYVYQTLSGHFFWTANKILFPFCIYIEFVGDYSKLSSRILTNCMLKMDMMNSLEFHSNDRKVGHNEGQIR